MLVRTVAMSAFLAASFVSPAVAQQPAVSASGDIVVNGQRYENKVICRFEQNTGTRFQTRICHTNKEWDQMRENHLRAAREIINDTSRTLIAKNGLGDQ